MQNPLIPYEARRLLLGEIVYAVPLNAYVLTSQVVFIGDVDVKDPELKRQAINRIHNVGKRLGLRFRVYETHSGIRFFEITSEWDWDEYFDLIGAIFFVTECDKAYVEISQNTQTFRARLTNKGWRKERVVAIHVPSEFEGEITNPVIEQTIMFHDLIACAERKES